MGATTSGTCPHCGAALEPLRLTLAGEQMTFGWAPCPCEGAAAQRAREEAAEAERERARAERARRAAYARAGIPRRFLSAEDPRAAALAEAARRGRGAYVCGPVGTGKTHLAAAAARILVDEGRDVRFTDMLGVLAEVRGTYGTAASEDSVLSRLSRCSLLVLDDLGKEAPTDWTLGQVFRVVNDRYETMRPVLVTTQYRRSDLIRRLSRSGDAETAVAIVSRLCEMCDTVELAGADRRTRHGEG